jgi:hypothetical protein
MIKLLKLFELDFPTSAEEQPSAFEGENEAIQEYVNAVKLNEPKGTTIDKVTEELKDAALSTQLKALIALAKNNLLVVKSKKSEEEYDEDDTIDEMPFRIIKPEEVLQMFNDQSDIAYDTLVNYNLNENRVDYYIDKNGNKLQVIDANYLQYPGRVMVKYDNIDEAVEYKGNFEADLKSGIVKRLNSEINEAFFIGENKTIECEKCGWRWDLEDDGGVNDNPYLCHKCDYDNSYRYNDEIEEYDVDETNLHEVKDFIRFMKEYSSFLAEAQCDCVYEALYKGRKVQLGKPMQGDIKKFKVYVKNNKGKVVKVNFGFGGKSAHGKRMVIKRNNPVHRNAYRKRHHCDKPGPRWKANYWSCRKW